MPWDIPIGNGNLLVTHDQSYVLRDIYYPFVGRENHTDGHGFHPKTRSRLLNSWPGGTWRKIFDCPLPLDQRGVKDAEFIF